jgi:hypothetical protein
VTIPIDAPVATTTQIGSGRHNSLSASLSSPQQEKVNVRDPMNSPEDCREDNYSIKHKNLISLHRLVYCHIDITSFFLIIGIKHMN